MNESKFSETLATMAIGAGIMGVMGKMLGFGNNEVEKKDLIKGVVNLVLETYETEITSLENEVSNHAVKNSELSEEITSLKLKVKSLEEKLKAKKKSSRTKAKRKR